MQIFTVEATKGDTYGQVNIHLDNGQEITVIVHQSSYTDTINMEIDGNFSDGAQSLRVHLNDGLIVDTLHREPRTFTDPRQD